MASRFGIHVTSRHDSIDCHNLLEAEGRHKFHQRIIDDPIPVGGSKNLCTAGTRIEVTVEQPNLLISEDHNVNLYLERKGFMYYVVFGTAIYQPKE